jgi:hypothetical protein
MAINKNFIVKNGFEAGTNLIFADADTREVGIGTTNPEYTLHVIGGIGVTNSFVSGISTVLTELNVGTGGTVLTVLGVGNSIGIGTALPAYLLDIRSPVSTGQTALYVYGDVIITGDLSVDDITFDDATLSNLTVTEALNVPNTGIGTIVTFNSTNSTITNLTGTAGTITTFDSTNGTITNLTGTAGTITTFDSTNGTITNLTGTAGTITTFDSTNGTITNLTGTAGTITTFDSTNGTITNLTGTAATIGNVNIVSGIITAASGIVTYYGDGAYLQNLSVGVGIQSAGNVVGYGVTTLNFIGVGNTFAVDGNTVNISIAGGGGGIGFATYLAGIATAVSVGVNTTNLDDPDLTGIGNSFQGLYIGNGMIIVDNALNGNHYIGTNFNGLMAGPVTVNGTLTVDGNWVVV